MSNAPICFLLINASSELAKISINSCLEVSREDIYIGYTGNSDIDEFENISRIKLIDLTPEASILGIASGEYADFSQKDFFVLVQLKWSLISRVLRESEANQVQYSDLDVLWISDPSLAIASTFQNHPKKILLIQDFTTDPSSANLCMGYCAFRNSPESFKLIEKLKNSHSEILKLNPYLGDDDVVTEYFRSNGGGEVLKLPQSTFPVGSLGLLFSGKTFFPGVRVPSPYIFHANYVIGTHRKIEYLVLVASHLGVKLTEVKFSKKVKYLITSKLRKFYFLLKFK